MPSILSCLSCAHGKTFYVGLGTIASDLMILLVRDRHSAQEFCGEVESIHVAVSSWFRVSGVAAFDSAWPGGGPSSKAVCELELWRLLDRSRYRPCPAERRHRPPAPDGPTGLAERSGLAYVGRGQRRRAGISSAQSARGGRGRAVGAGQAGRLHGWAGDAMAGRHHVAVADDAGGGHAALPGRVVHTPAAGMPVVPGSVAHTPARGCRWCLGRRRSITRRRRGCRWCLGRRRSITRRRRGCRWHLGRRRSITLRRRGCRWCLGRRLSITLRRRGCGWRLGRSRSITRRRRGCRWRLGRRPQHYAPAAGMPVAPGSEAQYYAAGGEDAGGAWVGRAV